MTPVVLLMIDYRPCFRLHSRFVEVLDKEKKIIFHRFLSLGTGESEQVRKWSYTHNTQLHIAKTLQPDLDFTTCMAAQNQIPLCILHSLSNSFTFLFFFNC